MDLSEEEYESIFEDLDKEKKYLYDLQRSLIEVDSSIPRPATGISHGLKKPDLKSGVKKVNPASEVPLPVDDEDDTEESDQPDKKDIVIDQTMCKNVNGEITCQAEIPE